MNTLFRLIVPDRKIVGKRCRGLLLCSFDLRLMGIGLFVSDQVLLVESSICLECSRRAGWYGINKRRGHSAAVQYRWIKCDAMRDYLVSLLLSDQHPGTLPSDILLHSTPVACAISCGVYKIDRESRDIRETKSTILKNPSCHSRSTAAGFVSMFGKWWLLIHGYANGCFRVALCRAGCNLHGMLVIFLGHCVTVVGGIRHARSFFCFIRV